MLPMLLVAILGLEELTHPRAVFWYGDLLAEGGYGRLSRERAAFLIRETDGGFTLAPWPHGGFRHATFRGDVPAGAVAVLHTHPLREPQPSQRDKAEARRLGLPIVVITPDAVIAATPDGTELTLLGRGWSAR